MFKLGATSLALTLCLTMIACDDETTPVGGDGGADISIYNDGPITGEDGPVVGDGQGGDVPQVLDGPQAGDGPQVGEGTLIGDGKAHDGPMTGDSKVFNDVWIPKDIVTAKDIFFFPDGSNPGNKVYCHGKIYQCADGIDNDQDGLVDAKDPECTGPCDNDEGSMELNIPGVNRDPCKQDCYWDYNSGGGNDDCDWNHKCDPKSPGANLGCPFDANYGPCDPAQSQTCINYCVPITPNGCDCFGCCEIYTPAGKYKDTVFLGSGTTCTVAAPQNCAPCTQVLGCVNTCAPCELCLGKTIWDLPFWCFTTQPHDAGPPDAKLTDGPKPSDGPLVDGPPPGDAQIKIDGGVTPLPWCPPGVTPCLDNSHCPTNYYCITGCCHPGIG